MSPDFDAQKPRVEAPIANDGPSLAGLYAPFWTGLEAGFVDSG